MIHGNSGLVYKAAGLGLGSTLAPQFHLGDLPTIAHYHGKTAKWLYFLIKFDIRCALIFSYAEMQELELYGCKKESSKEESC
jgi:hypothetical protein